MLLFVQPVIKQPRGAGCAPTRLPLNGHLCSPGRCRNPRHSFRHTSPRRSPAKSRAAASDEEHSHANVDDGLTVANHKRLPLLSGEDVLNRSRVEMCFQRSKSSMCSCHRFPPRDANSMTSLHPDPLRLPVQSLFFINLSTFSPLISSDALCSQIIYFFCLELKR